MRVLAALLLLCALPVQGATLLNQLQARSQQDGIERQLRRHTTATRQHVWILEQQAQEQRRRQPLLYTVPVVRAYEPHVTIEVTPRRSLKPVIDCRPLKWC